MIFAENISDRGHASQAPSSCSGGSKGGREGRTPPPRRPNSFNFMQFLGEFGKIVCSRPPLEGSRPPLGEILDPSLLISQFQGFGSSTHIQLSSQSSFGQPALYLLYHVWQSSCLLWAQQ